MHSLKQFYKTAGRHPIKSAVLITLICALALFLINRATNVSDETAEPASLSQVTLSSAQSFAGGDSLSVIGNVRAFTEAAITTERAGRVVQVNVDLGQSVSAGQILATLENAAESAAVVQAEGAYDAAVAAKAQAIAADSREIVGVNESRNTLASARNTALSSIKSAYNTSNSIVISDLDRFYNQPQSPGTRLEIAGKGYTRSLETQRVALGDMLSVWKENVDDLDQNSNFESELDTSSQNAEQVLEIIDTFLLVFKESDDVSSIEQFTGIRSSLLNLLSSLDSAKISIENAKSTGNRADISTSVSSVPAADAQIKQALGSLQSAQANYAKTILRTPISGTVNSLNIKTGDFVNSFQAVAEVANNNALEIVTFVSDKERDALAVGDTVTIENQYEGRVSQIAPAIDRATRKTEVRITTENTNIKNGETVNISKDIAATSTATTAVTIPLTAVKFQIEDGFVFDVVDGKLVQNPVTLGTIRGNSVIITDGLSATDTFVVDARGLLPGAEVTVTE